MTTLQLRKAIKHAVDKVPESELTNLLERVHDLQKQGEDKAELIEFMKQAIIEDRELLQKLAE